MLTVVNWIVATLLVPVRTIENVVSKGRIHPFQLGPTKFQSVVDHAPEPDQIVRAREILFGPKPIEEKNQLEGPTTSVDRQQKSETRKTRITLIH